MNNIKRTFCFVALAAVATSATAAINSGYRIQGDKEAAPVQVFDDGRSIYVQLRDPRMPPAPFINNSPVNYKITGYYMTIPVVSRFELRYGPYSVLVSAKDNQPSRSTGARVYAPSFADENIVPARRVVSVDDQSRRDVVQPEYRVAQRARTTTADIDSFFGNTGSIASNDVQGEITISGERDAFDLPIAGRISANKFNGNSYIVKSDSTASGAKYALEVSRILSESGKIVKIEYHGSKAGFVRVQRKG